LTRRIKRTLQKSLVNHTIAERTHWAKFGQEKGNKPGPDRATTTVGENVALKITAAGNKVRIVARCGGYFLIVLRVCYSCQSLNKHQNKP